MLPKLILEFSGGVKLLHTLMGILMALKDAIFNLYSSDLELITVYKNGNVIFRGRIIDLKERNDLLEETLSEEIYFEIKKGYIAHLK